MQSVTKDAIDVLWRVQRLPMTLDARCILWNAANHLWRQLSDAEKREDA